MPSTATESLKLELQATGENSNTWGIKANTNFELIEDAIAGYVTVALGGASVSLSSTQFVEDESRNAFIELIGTLVSNVDVVIPAVPKGYVVRNKTTGSFTATVKTPSGSGFPVPQGTAAHIFTEGTTVVPASYPVSADVSTIDGKIRAVGDVRYALVSSTNTFTAPQVFNEAITMVSAPINEAKGATFTAAAVVTLGGATGNFVDVSGSTSITSFGSAVAGTSRELRAISTVAVVYNSTSMILPGKANAVMRPNDVLEMRSLGASNWIAPALKRAVKPRFSALMLASQSIPPNNVSTKILFDLEEFDNNDNYNSTLARFTPTVPGIYMVNIIANLAAINASKTFGLQLFKNGAAYKQVLQTAGVVTGLIISLSCLVEMNGTTDFLEAFASNSDTFAQSMFNTTTNQHFSAFLVD